MKAKNSRNLLRVKSPGSEKEKNYSLNQEVTGFHPSRLAKLYLGRKYRSRSLEDKRACPLMTGVSLFIFLLLGLFFCLTLQASLFASGPSSYLNHSFYFTYVNDSTFPAISPYYLAVAESFSMTQKFKPALLSPLPCFQHQPNRSSSITIQGITVPSGQSRFLSLKVTKVGDRTITIPVTVINGLRPGPVLALVAGVHGYEYPPILALYRVKKLITPRDLKGTLLLVHIANLPSFQRRTIYYNPYDWKNLNRVFPGNPEGTVSERIAYVLTEEVVKRSDYLIDCHCGDGNEALIPYTYWMVTGKEELDQRSKELALAFGIDKIIIDKTRSKDIINSKYLGNTAVLLGKPAITIESGYLGRSDEEDIKRVVDGVMNVLRHLRMIEGKPSYVVHPTWIDNYQVVYSEHDGLFHPLKKRGEKVTKGEKVGYLTGYDGQKITDLFSPLEGIILYILGTPPANKGEPLYEVGHLKQ